MTTNLNTLINPLEDASGGVPSNPPDVAELTRMANQFYSILPVPEPSIAGKPAVISEVDAWPSLASRTPYHVSPSVAAASVSRTHAESSVAPRGPYGVSLSAAARSSRGLTQSTVSTGRSNNGIAYADPAVQTVNRPNSSTFGNEIPFTDTGLRSSSAGSSAPPFPGLREPSFYFLDGPSPFGTEG